MAGKDTLVRVRNLKTQFFLREGVVRACDGVDLSIERGMTLGVVGESGCGKSVTAQSIMRIVPKPGRIVAGDITLYQVGKQTRDFALTEEVKITDLDPMGLEMRSLRGQAISMISRSITGSWLPTTSISIWANCRNRPACGRSYRKVGPMEYRRRGCGRPCSLCSA